MNIMAENSDPPAQNNDFATEASPNRRTPSPSDWDHAKTLIGLTFRKDRRKPKLWALKFFLMPALLMLYTVGFFVGYEGRDDNTVVIGDYRLFSGQDWNYPARMKMGAFEPLFLEEVAHFLSYEFNYEILYGNQTTDLSEMTLQIISNANSSSNLISECHGNIDEEAAKEICIYIRSENSYEIFFGGKETASPAQPALAGAQYAINTALLNVSNIEAIFPISKIQQAPQLLTKDTVQPHMAAVLVPSCMYVLSALVCSLILVGSIVYEKINGIAKSYVLVGVRMRTYLLQWVLYYSLNGIILALLMTMVCIFFNLMPMSNFGLVYVSNYLGLVQMFSMLVIGMQLVSTEEMTSALIWLTGLLSIAIGAGVTALSSSDSAALTVLSVFSPYIGMIQYIGIYITYDSTGYNTGLHPGHDVVESGLLGNMIAQICGIVLWISIILVYSSSRVRGWLSSGKGSALSHHEYQESSTEDTSKFEPLLPGKEVVLSLQGVCHTFHVPKLSCSKRDSVQVLNGLSMNVCRGEIFGYLGHNGSGKSTSVGILSGELQLQKGRVTYNFREGEVHLSDSSAEELIHKKIGVCPQHNDSLQPDLTCKETLDLFARLKGNIAISDGQTIDQAISEEVERRLNDVKFTSDDDIDKPVGQFSGGMKRKVLIALALLGDPEVIFLDEPTAGLDPYNRRVIWDCIIAAKQGRSIVLTTHFMDEADVLADNIGILKDGKLTTCGSSLFLKHNFGAGYMLSFKSSIPFDVTSIVPTAVNMSIDNDGSDQIWRLSFGTELSIPVVLSALDKIGATGVSLEMTTLEEVFLKTGQEDVDDDSVEDSNHDQDEMDAEIEAEIDHDKFELQARIWEKRAISKPVTSYKKFLLVQNFVMTNAVKVKGFVILNLTMPLIYLVVGLVAVSLIPTSSEGEIVSAPPIMVSSIDAVLSGNGLFFGIENIGNHTFSPLIPIPEPKELTDYFERNVPVVGGYYTKNQTLQYAPAIDIFALQLSAAVMANYSYYVDDGIMNATKIGISTSVQQLPYITDEPFRFDLLFLPMALSFGFAGLAFVVLDILLLKGDNIIGVFRVVGITEAMTYCGVFGYKMMVSFLPFFVLTLVLGASLKSVIMGNGGRWLGTIFVMASYAYSGTPVGLIYAKRFATGNLKEVANWLPGVYYICVSLPFIAWAAALQAAPESQRIILIIGDVLCVIPFFAFQYGIGSVILVSTEYNDPNLTWKDVWSLQSRISYSILMMFLIGSLEWGHLCWLTNRRDNKSKLSDEERLDFAMPVDVSDSPDINEERERSRSDDNGINATDLVKVFCHGRRRKQSKERLIKQAVKGVSFGIRKNEILCLLGPNGSGKSTTMNILASQITPDYGEIGLNGKKASGDDKITHHLYDNQNISYVPQVDALFSKKTVEEHLKFYSEVRGLEWDNELTQNHVCAITRLLNMDKHKNKLATDLSGGYKRRLCLCIAMIAYPTVILVDECTTGLDPAARRLVHDVLKPDARNGAYDVPAILFSSHYMDECEHLGSRIGIMIDGEFVAIGTLERLQELYCNGLFVDISLQPTADHSQSELNTVDAFSKIHLDASVYESLPFHFKLRIVPSESMQAQNNVSILSNAFRLLEDEKEELGIQFYSVALMNLEQIFIDLSRKQFMVDDNFQSRRELSTR